MMRPNRGRSRSSDRSADRPTPDTPVNWRRLFGYLSPYKGRMAVAILALVFYGAAGLVFALVIGNLLQSVVQQKDFSQLNVIAVGLVALFLFQATISFVQSYNLTFIGERIVLDLRTTLYRHLHALSLDFYANRRVGELVSRISSDVTQVRSVLTNNITQLLTSLISLIGSIIIVFALDPRLTPFILILVPILMALAILFGRSFHGFVPAVFYSTGSAPGRCGCAFRGIADG